MKTDSTTKRESGHLRVFLSYAHKDEAAIKPLAERLRADHFEPWRDSESLKPGASWPQETLRAISDSDIVVVCLSTASSGKGGFLQREISTALTANVLIIPALLDQCEIPKELVHCHAVELFDNEGYERLRAKLMSLAKTVERYYPGGPVNVDAGHYINRDWDDEAVDALEGPPFTLLVQGPVQCGKSSLLTRLQKSARDIGIATAWFDPSAYTADTYHRPSHTTNSNTRAAKALAEHLQNEWMLDPPRKGRIESLGPWLMKALEHTASQPRLLIIDDLASLGFEATEAWLKFLREVQNRRASGVRMSVAVGLTHSFGSDFEFRQMRIDSNVSWNPRVELDWFNRDEVRDLETRVLGAPSADDDLYDLFAGQPYLTHAAAHDKRFRESVRAWRDVPEDQAAELVRGSKFYKHHQAGILWAMLGKTTRPDADTRKILQSFVTACSGDAKINPDYEGFFRKAKLIGRDGAPSLGIYSLMVEYFTQIIGIG